MLEIYEANASVFSINQVTVSWKIKPTSESVNLYTFTVYRAQSPEGPFNKLIDLKNQFVYHDADVGLKSKWRQFFYKIMVFEDADETNFMVSPVAQLPYEADPIALEIIRRNNILLDRFVGTPVKIYLKKSFGQYCRECFDFIKQRRRKSGCLICFDTNFVGGYFGPITTKANFNPSQKQIQQAGFELEPDSVASWMSNYPLLKPKDLILETGDKFWRVVNQTQTEKLRIPVHQMLHLKRVNHSDIEYTLPRIALTEDEEVPEALEFSRPN